MLHGRAAEQAAVAALLAEARASRGGALVLRGQPGAGKSALLADAVARAESMRVLRTSGVESESPLAFAALQRLLRPVASLTGRLPARQARALRAAFGEADDPETDRFVVFLGALSLLTEAAADRPVLAVVDDAHWLDDASAAALLFVARRVHSEPVALLFAAREGDVRGFDGPDLPDLAVGGLDPAAAAALLSEQAGTSVPAEVGARLVADTGGNPLALVELPTALSPDQLAGRAPLPARLPVTEGVERVFLDRARRLSAPARTLLLVAAADDSGRVATVRAGAAALGVDERAFDEVERSGLVRVQGPELELRHPLVRSAVHTAATSGDRRRAHRALAEAFAAERDPDRRAWHLAAATDRPDEAVAAELEAVATRARRRGGQEAAAAALERAAELTPQAGDPRARRLLEAARAAWLGGAPQRAGTLSDAALQQAQDPGLRADAARLRARVEWNTGSLELGHRMVLAAARDVAPVDPARAREMAMFAAALASFGGASGIDLDPVRLVPPAAATDPPRVRCFDALLRGLAPVPGRAWAEAAPHLRAAFAIAEDLEPDDQDLLPNLGIAALHLQDDHAILDFHTRLLTRARDTGATIMVLYALTRRAFGLLATGRWVAARADVAEALQLARGTGRPGLAAMPLAWTALLAALRGEDPADLAEADALAAAHPLGTLRGLVHDVLHWTRAVAEAEHPAVAHGHLAQVQLPVVAHLSAIDLLEAAARADRPDDVRERADELAEFARATGAAWAAAAAAHGRALVGGGTAAFEEALAHHARSGRRVDHARTRLAYGEHLRRARRRVDARPHLRAALETFEEVGAQRRAERARRELRASGETARRRDGADTAGLTPQELQVASLVAQGMPNREVAARLFVSPRTVDFHLRNVFSKLGISSRGELARAGLA